MQILSVNEVNLDYSIYPRTRLDKGTVALMTEALRSGAMFPPVLIDASSKRVIDGFHRVTMYRQSDRSKPIEVIERHYENAADMFADAVRLNAAHGKRLDLDDRLHCLKKSKELGLSVGVLASALCMTVETVGGLQSERPGKMRVVRASNNLDEIPTSYGRENARFNSARARQVVVDINEGFMVVLSDLERIALLAAEARACKYWQVDFKSAAEWSKRNAVIAAKIHNAVDKITAAENVNVAQGKAS
jgi:hypothetical protein